VTKCTVAADPCQRPGPPPRSSPAAVRWHPLLSSGTSRTGGSTMTLSAWLLFAAGGSTLLIAIRRKLRREIDEGHVRAAP